MMASKAGHLYLECAAISSELLEANFSGIVIEPEDTLRCRDRGMQINWLKTLFHPVLTHLFVLIYWREREREREREHTSGRGRGRGRVSSRFCVEHGTQCGLNLLTLRP